MKRFTISVILICLTQISYARFELPWIDSVVTLAVQKIGEAKSAELFNGGAPSIDPFTGEQFGSHYIVINVAEWLPDIDTSQHYYERKEDGMYINNPGTPIFDSLNIYASRHHNHPGYIQYFNIVLDRFPLALKKNISAIQPNETGSFFTQLQQAGAIANNDYQYSCEQFRKIIDTIVAIARTQFNLDKVVCLGTAQFVGQYGKMYNMRASFGAYYVKSSGFNPSPTWVYQLPYVAKNLCPPFEQAWPSLSEKNLQLATAIQHYIECNAYGDCIMDPSVFSNPYARWLYDNLKTSTVISKPLLLSTCIRVNGLEPGFAWSVLTMEYETGYNEYNMTSLGPVYNSYTDSSLVHISRFCEIIPRAKSQFKNNNHLERDSTLYYGWFVYRVPSFMLELSNLQRIHLLRVITTSICRDLQGGTSDYENHCELICKSLYTNLPAGQEKAFMDELRGQEVIWKLSYRLSDGMFGFFGNDNYTDFIFTISVYWQRAYPERSHPSEMSTINYHTILWVSSFWGSNGKCERNGETNNVTLLECTRPDAVLFQPLGSYQLDVYDPVVIYVGEGSLIPNLPGIKKLVVPAIFLEWLYHKKTIDNVATSVKVSAAALALATGIGEMYAATTFSMQMIAGLQVAISTSDLILMSQSARNSVIAQFDTQQEGEEFLALYENISFAINVTAGARALIATFDYDCAQFVSKFDVEEQGLKVALGESSDEYRALEKLREEIGSARATTQWMDDLEAIIGPGTHFKIQGWIDNGLNAAKTELAFANAGDKAALYNSLDQAYSIYHQRVLIRDWDNIPGLTSGEFVANGLNGVRSNPAWNNQALDLPASQSINFTSAFPDELPPGTKIYRVTSGRKEAAWWTLNKPNTVGEVIDGTAVRPEWNGFTHIYEYEVPQNSTLKVWRGPAARQQVTNDVTNPYLGGGAEQLYLPDAVRDEAFKIRIDEIDLPW